MPDIDDVNDRILQTAADGVSKSVVDKDEVTVLSIEEQIKAANHIASQTAASTGGGKFGMRFSRLVPPGCG